MGLDNSIEVRRTAQTDKIKALQRFNCEWDKEHKHDFEVIYYRKCWNIRQKIFEKVLKENDFCCQYPLNIEQIDQIIEVLGSFNAKNWDNVGHGSIWDWEDDDMKRHLREDIKNLEILRKLMKKYDLEVYFVDSY